MTAAQHLTELETSGLVRLAATQPEIEYLFRHALVQDAAYASILKADRRRLHQLVGEVVERAYADRLDELAPVLAQHFDEGGDEERALEYYRRAGDAAAAVYANAEAEMQYARAIALLRRRPVLSEQMIHIYANRGRALELSGRYEEAVANYTDLQTLGRERQDRPAELSALMALAAVYSAPTTVHNPEQVETVSEQALAVAREIGDRAAEAKIAWSLMLHYRFAGRARESVAYGEQALSLARELNLKEQLAFVLNDIYLAYLTEGAVEKSEATIAEARALWAELGNQPMLADAWSNTACLHLFRAEYAQVLETSREAQRISESIGNLWGQSYSRFYTGYAYLALGEYAAAMEAMQTCIRLGEPAGFFVPQADTRSALALAFAEVGDLPRAFEQARLALAAAVETFPLWKPLPLSVLGLLHLQAGDVAAAAPAVAEAVQGVDATGVAVLEMVSTVKLAEVRLALAQGQPAQALSIAETALAHMQQMSLASFTPALMLAQAEALLALERSAEARTVLEAARAQAERTRERTVLWPVLAALSRLEAARGNADEARVLRTQAREVVTYIAEHCPAQTRDSFRARPDVRAVLAAA